MFRAILHFGIIEFGVILLLLQNIITFLLYAIDKAKSKSKGRRISERTLLLFTLFFGGIGALLGMMLVRHKTRKGKFRVCVVLGVVFTLVPIVHFIHSVTLDRIIEYREVPFTAQKWPQELDGYRIAFATDLHNISDEQMDTVVENLSARQIDLLLLGGDFSMRNGHYRDTVRQFARLATTDGIFGVWGNHDDPALLFSAFTDYGIVPLDNQGLRIRNGFYLAGVSDLWHGLPDISAAIVNAETDDFVLLISHNPDVSMEQSTIGVDLILSGHTHGGQIAPFGYPIWLHRGSVTAYGTRFAHGFAESADGTPVFTSRGAGPYYQVPRIFARPEIVIFTMYSV